MINTQTIDGLHTLKLSAMAQGLQEQRQSAQYQALGFEERLGMLVDREIEERENRRLERMMKNAKLRHDAVIEDIDFHTPRGLERSQILTLAEGTWILNHHNLSIVGPTGCGKSFISCALARAGIKKGFSALYLRAPRMLETLEISRLDGRLASVMASWARIEILLIDDFLIRPLSPDQAGAFLEVIEDRTGTRSTIITSQLPISSWHEAMGDPTLGDAILDRITQNLHRIELHGESMRKKKNSTAS